MRIVIVAAELSGDLLGADLVEHLKQKIPAAEFCGIAGSKMKALGVESIYPMEPLSVMGVGEVLRKLYPILKIRRGLISFCKKTRPDLYIGIDAPDFNLGVEEKLRKLGIPTVHYVSPSIWAWKAWRIHRIKRATDLVLCILPFEPKIYENAGHPALFIGHPLAQKIPLHSDQTAARVVLGVKKGLLCLAILPGSRRNEFRYLLEIFLAAARLCKEKIPELELILPLAAPHLARLLLPYQAEIEALNLRVIQGKAQEAMAAADAILVTSGTATLEAMLIKRPLVVAYKMGRVSFWVARQMVKLKHFSLPNILAGEKLVPEFLQKACTPNNLSAALCQYLLNPAETAGLLKKFEDLHHVLKKSSGELAAGAIVELLAKKNS